MRYPRYSSRLPLERGLDRLLGVASATDQVRRATADRGARAAAALAETRRREAVRIAAVHGAGSPAAQTAFALAAAHRRRAEATRALAQERATAPWTVRLGESLFHGRVVDRTGDGQRGLEIEAHVERVGVVAVGRTDERGYFQVRVPPSPEGRLQTVTVVVVRDGVRIERTGELSAPADAVTYLEFTL